MLDESLPTFFFRRSEDDVAHHSTLYFSINAEALTPKYSLRRFDPSLPASKNCYSTALVDPFNPQILYGEVLIKPEWTQPSLSAEQIRLNGGQAPPPQLIAPSTFSVQLYNPDQEIVVRYVAGSWNSSPYWQFELPETTFRRPSASSLDQSQNDPASSITTPKVIFRWKREGKLSKDFTCAMCGKTNSSTTTKKKATKEPDIAIALFRSLRELTVYQPNLHRVDVEDLKGLELTLLLSAATIRDLTFGNLSEIFNSDPKRGGTISTAQREGQRRPTPENEAQTARRRRQEEAERREREKQEQADARRVRKMVEAEEKEKRRRQAEVDKETERLRRIYAEEERQARKAGMRAPVRPAQPRYSAPVIAQGARPVSVPPPTATHHWGRPWGQGGSTSTSNGPSSSSHYYNYGPPRPPLQQGQGQPGSGGGQQLLRPDDGRRLDKRRRSFFGLRGADEAGSKLNKKKSSLF